MGGPPLANGQRPLSQSYENVDESIPIGLVGHDADEVAQALQLLKTALGGATTTTPIIWRHCPYGASNDVYAEVYSGTVQETAVNDELSAVEGWSDVAATITLTRSPFFGAADLLRVLNASAVTNGASGNVFSLGDVFGDLALEGQPLNVAISKPTTGVASGVILATVANRWNTSIAGTLSAITSTTSGSAFFASSSFDVAALRRLSGVALHILARVHTITAPSKAQLAVEIQTAGGVVLWRSSWVRLGSDTTGQLVDLGAATLDMLRIPLPAAHPYPEELLLWYHSTGCRFLFARCGRAVHCLLSHG